MDDQKNSIINFYDYMENDEKHNPNYETHKIKVPFRMLFCSGSGSGKTNMVMNLIYLFDDTFEKIVIYTMAHEPLYDKLKEDLDPEGKGIVEVFYDKQPEKLDDDTNSDDRQTLIIFDDMVGETKYERDIFNYFKFGRKHNFSCIYISQTFFNVPKKLRAQCEFILLGFGLTTDDLESIFRRYPVLNLHWKKLKEIYYKLVPEKMNFMCIDLQNNMIRKNIIDYFIR